VADAFDLMYYLERACQAQIGALSGGAEVIVASDEVAEKVAQQFERPERAAKTKHWEACLRLLDRTDPSYKH
jgi:ribulose-5-phosphate 4-epimerase/fuculose-1-phosphate aldolase